MYACLQRRAIRHSSSNARAIFRRGLRRRPPTRCCSTSAACGSLFGEPVDIARAIENRAGIPVDIAIAADPDAAISRRAAFAASRSLRPAMKRRSSRASH